MNTCTLILNAAEARIQTVLTKDGTLVCAEEWSAPSQGTELLTPVLADMLRHLKLQPQDISRIACVAGPGSFTGLRLVLTTAAAFRRATGASVASLNTLHALATTFPAELLAGNAPVRVRVITHARRGLVHGQDFLCGTGLPLPVTEPAMWEIATACAAPFPQFMIGSGVAKNLDYLQTALASQNAVVRLLPGDFDQPTPRALMALTAALPETAWGHQDIDPLYLRPCDAVDNLGAIAGKRGQAPEEAYAELDRLLAPIRPEQIH